MPVEGSEHRRVVPGPVAFEAIAADAPAIVDVISSTAQAVALEADEVDQALLQMGPEVTMEGLEDGEYWTFSGQVINGNGDDVELGGALTGVTVTPDQNGYFEYESNIFVGSGLGTVTATVPGGNVATVLYD